MRAEPERVDEFRRALVPLHRCEAFRNTIWDMWGTWELPVIFGWRKNCPCRRIRRQLMALQPPLTRDPEWEMQDGC